jgi:hypothetical protein
MRHLIVVAAICTLGVLAAGCADPNTKPTHVGFGTSTDTMSMGPALRLVTERERPFDKHHSLPTVCTEPSPDVAIAFSRSLQAQAQVQVQEPSGPSGSGSGSVNVQNNETATTLNGRTAGVLALRDGLYAACQSYINGVIGHDAYAIILSQYGNLLIALAGQQTSGAPVTYTPEQSAFAALFVACVSEYDPTRLTPGVRHNNGLLTPRRCGHVLDLIASGQLLKPPPKSASNAPAKKTTKLAAGEKLTTTSKTVLEQSGPTAAAPAPAAGK